MIRRAFTFAIATATLLAPLFGQSTAYAEDPTAESLIKRVPLLSPTNKDLNSFQCTIDIVGASVPLSMEVAWKRPDRFGLLVVDTRLRSPIMYYAERSGMVVDIVNSKLLILDRSRMDFVFQIGKTGIKFNTSINTAKPGDSKSRIALDFSLLLRAAALAKPEQVDKTTWKLVTGSDSTKAMLKALFKPAQSQPLHRLELQFNDKSVTKLVVRNITINKPLHSRYQQFVRLEGLPRTLKIIRSSNVKDAGNAKSPSDNPHKSALNLLNAMAANAALHFPSLRNSPDAAVYLKDVDWSQTANNERIITPALRKLLDVPGRRIARAVRPRSATKRTATRPRAVRQK